MPLPHEQIIENIRNIRTRVERAALQDGRSLGDVRIMAVTKTVTPPLVNLAAGQGIRFFGENRVQEYLDRRENYRLNDGEVHFIGHLQTNKVKYIIDKVDMIESLSSVKLALEIEERAAERKRIMPVLLEINISGEESKSGFSPDELVEAALQISDLEHLALAGLMCIPESGSGESAFPRMRSLFGALRSRLPDPMRFSILSMGMSADYEEAVRCGSNLIRLGSAIFGARDPAALHQA